MIELTAEQQSAVDMACKSDVSLCCLTGGPGTGKSTTIQAIVEALNKDGHSVSLCAPSGKAAKRIQEASGFDASTIHSLIKAAPGGKFNQPVETSVLIMDEASMTDLPTMGMLLQACQDSVSTILLVGDPNQLPPVGPGKPFHDVVDRVPTVRLTEIHRQAQESGIIRAAYAIREGHSVEWAHDIRMVHEPRGEQLFDLVENLILQEGLQNAQVLIPARSSSPWGTTKYNEHVESKREGVSVVRERAHGRLVSRLVFREGSRVICTKNDYQNGVFNGESGEVVEVSPGNVSGKDQITVLYEGHDNPITYGGEGLDRGIDSAWALTTHKSQGSEWDDVIFLAHPSYSRLLNRNLLYVAMTRAKKRLWVVGDEQCVQTAVRQPWAEIERKTLLPTLLAPGVDWWAEAEGEEVEDSVLFFADEARSAEGVEDDVLFLSDPS